MNMNSKNKNASENEMPSSIGGFLVFSLKAIFKKRKYWLFPIWILLLSLAILLYLSGTSALLPAIYMAF